MTFVFKFSEPTAQKLDALMDDLQHGGGYYAGVVIEWRSQYRRQLSEQESRQRKAGVVAPYREECNQ